MAVHHPLHPGVGDAAPPPMRRRDDYSDVSATLRELRAMQRGSPEFRRLHNAVTERCLPLADHIATRFHGRGEPYPDLVQVARVGLVSAIDRFDTSAHTDFLAYAVPTMMGEVRRHFRDHGWAVKVPRRLKDLHLRCRVARQELTQRLGRAPTATEIADYLEIDREEVIEAVVASNSYSTSSVDAPSAASDGSIPMSDRIGIEDDGFQKVLDVETIRPLLAALPARELAILRMRFFDEMSQSQIALKLGLSQMHISRLLASTLSSLRDAARAGEPA
jgi:RNA polymerase sigma-B factor